MLARQRQAIILERVREEIQRHPVEEPAGLLVGYAPGAQDGQDALGVTQ